MPEALALDRTECNIGDTIFSPVNTPNFCRKKCKRRIPNNTGGVRIGQLRVKPDKEACAKHSHPQFVGKIVLNTIVHSKHDAEDATDTVDQSLLSSHCSCLATTFVSGHVCSS